MAELGVYADMQPAWFYKDADAMQLILGNERIRSFHPYHSLLKAGCVREWRIRPDGQMGCKYLH